MADDKVLINEKWCLTEDRSRVVPETDPAARWLYWKPGDVVPRAEAERLGAVKRKPGRPAGAGKSEAKKAEPAENKARIWPTESKRK